MKTMTIGSKWLIQYAGSTCMATVERVRKHYGSPLFVCRVNMNGRDLVQTLNFRAAELTVVA